MATFYSDLRFNINTLDFSTPLQVPHSISLLGGADFFVNLPKVQIGDVSYNVPAHDFAYQSGIKVMVSGTVSGEVLAGDDFAFDPEGILISGTTTVLATLNQGFFNIGVAGFALSAVTLNTAAQSATTDDDRSLFATIFAGNDLITTGSFDDRFDGGAGKDLFYDFNGDDTLSGGDGDDLMTAGRGADRVNGDAGKDVILGGKGDDVILGGTGADVIWAGPGTDIVTGGAGADVFLFKAGDGIATITDFKAGDQILFMGLQSGLANLQMTKVGADLWISFSNLSIQLLDTQLSDVPLTAVATGGNAALVTAADAFFAGWDYA